MPYLLDIVLETHSYVVTYCLSKFVLSQFALKKPDVLEAGVPVKEPQSCSFLVPDMLCLGWVVVFLHHSEHCSTSNIRR